MSSEFHKSVLEFLADSKRMPNAMATNDACKWALQQIKELEKLKKLEKLSKTN